MFFAICLMEMNVSNSGYVFEDLYYQDMNYANFNLVKNGYAPVAFSTFFIFLLQFILFGEKLRIQIPRGL